MSEFKRVEFSPVKRQQRVNIEGEEEEEEKCVTIKEEVYKDFICEIRERLNTIRTSCTLRNASYELATLQVDIEQFLIQQEVERQDPA